MNGETERLILATLREVMSRLERIEERLSEDRKRLERIEERLDEEARINPDSLYSKLWKDSAPKPERKCEECAHSFTTLYPGLPQGMSAPYCRVSPKTSGYRLPCIEHLGQMMDVVDFASQHNPDGNCEKWQRRDC